MTAATSPSGHHTATTGLCVEKVYRSFGGLSALKDFSLALDRGELVGLIGPNGAGKTTAFNVVTGVYAPSSGHITLAGRRVDGHPPASICKAGIARTFQNIRLFANLTVLDNVAVALRPARGQGIWRTIFRTPGFARAEDLAAAEAMQLLDTFGLAARADELAASLPYGDQRRLEIARALATRPVILLLDEPAAGMNPQEKVALTQLIRFVRDEFGVGIWLIEHDMRLVMSICERLTVLDHGEIIAAGTPAEIQCDPKVIEAYLGEPGE